MTSYRGFFNSTAAISGELVTTVRDSSAGSASATGAGVRSGASVMVSPEDLLAHARDYGGYCRNLRAQAEALLAVEKGREVRP